MRFHEEYSSELASILSEKAEFHGAKSMSRACRSMRQIVPDLVYKFYNKF